MVLRTIRSLLAIVLSVCLVSSQTMGGWDVGILRAAKKAGGNKPEIADSPAQKNTPPKISKIADRIIAKNGVATATYLVNDAESPAGALRVAAISDNPDFLPNDRLVVTANGGERTLTATPLSDKEGIATITVTVTDGGGVKTSTNFSLTAKVDLPYVPGEIIVTYKTGVTPSALFPMPSSQGSVKSPSAQKAGMGLPAIRPLLRNPKRAATQRSSAQSLGRRSLRVSLGGDELSAKSLETLHRTYVLTFDSTQDVQNIKEALQRDPEVEIVQLNNVCSIEALDDPYFTEGKLWGLDQVHASSAWEMARGDGVVVAVVDSGIDATHSDLAVNVWTNPNETPENGIDDDANGFIDDVHGWNFVGHNNAPVDGNGHGTHVSGTIAAVGENGRGVIGLAYKAKIMPLKGMDDNGVGNIVDLANALMYAADNGADVVNASWGGNFPCASNSVIASAVQYAYGKGVTVVAAAGNSNSDVAGFTPAGCPNVISVAATDIGDGKAYFSNWGKIDVAAPGMGIISTVPGNIYGSKNGTSMACPHVSGLAALVLSKFPSYTNVQVRELIRSSSSDVGEEGFDPYFGYGRINAAKALSVNLETEPPTAPSNLNATTFPLLVKLTWTASSDNVEVKGYFLDVSSNADFSSFIETFNNLWLGNVTSQNIGGLVPSSTYYIRIRARDRVGNISSYSPVLRVTTSGPNMLPPSVNLRALKPTAMLVNWTPANNTIKEIAYLIQASTNSQFTSFSFSKPINVVHRNVLIENLQPKTTYYVRGLVYGEGWAVSAFGPTVVETTGDDQKTGTLDVISTPPGAWIYLKNNNGTWSEFLQVTPVTFKDLSEGTYEMKLVKSGYTDWVGTGTIMAGGTVTLNATLTSTTTGTITVNSTPAGAQIYYSYNGGAWTDTGVTTPYTFTNLAVGTYKAKLVKAGYVDGETALQTLTAGGALTMGATLTPATGSITVNSTPAGAQIYYSYNSGAWTDTGVTAPYTFTGLAVGTYKAKLVKAGYVDGETALQTLTAGGSLTMGATLTAATGNITVNSTPAGARIYYSYNSGAWTDTGVTAPYTFTGLAVGTYKAKLVKAGYVDGETALQTLTAGGALTMGATLTPATGSITVNSTPAGAQIYYSYNSGAWTDTGVTAPYTFTGLAVGTYKAKLVKAGYVDGETALQTLTAGGSLTMGATLTPATGSITVNSTPAGARIYYSYNSGAWTDTGVTTPYTFTGLAVGTYKAKLVKAGYVDGETALQTLTAGGALTMGATLTPATGSITVNSTPAGARIYYSYNSGAWTDTGITTPYTFTGLAVGTYKAKLVKAGYVDGETALQTLTAGGALTMGATLTPATGSITVNSTPAGARIYYSYNSGAWTDTGITTPYTFTGLAVGTYKAKLVKAGYVDGETALQTLTAGGALTMGATLTPATGSITVNSTPAGAQIYYSYNSGAWTDTGVTAPNTFTNLAVGTYKAKLVKAGYVDGETALQTLTAGGALTMGATLTPATGSITVNSTPAGAQIYYSYNGGAWTDTGVSTPYTFTNLAVGTYKAKLVKAGYVDGETALQTLTAGGSLTMGATLTAATGSITVNSTPAGARIYYSYNSGAWTDTGVTTPYTFTGLAVGTYKAKLVKAGYVDGETALQTLTAGGALTMGATLTPATGSITVNSTPAGARIYYSYNSGAWTDTGVTTPYTFTGLAVGTYKAKLVKAGYVDGETALQTLTAGGALTMGATLTPATGSITVNSTPAGARIYYSYNSGAWTDTGVSTPYTFTNLAVGTYKAKLVKAGYVDGETALQTLTAGGALTMGATLTPATGSITVNSTPAGARIYYSYNSGAWTDTGITTPYTFTGLAVGTYKAKLVKAGYVDGETALQTLTAGGSLTMGATLTAATGNITVNSTPAGAQIYYSYNGGAWTDTGVSTPYTFTNLAVGTYKAKLVKAGYVDGETALQTLTAGGSLTMGATLTPATGSITVNSTPAGARIYYSYNSGAWTDTGVTTPYTFTGLAVGTYKAKLVKAGYVDGETALQTLTAGGSLTMGATLTPATGSITVNSTPAGARIYYSYNSGAWTDTGITTPYTFTGLAVGTYKAKLVKAGYVDGETALQTLTAGGALTMGATLTPATGSITVNSTPAGARIYYSYNSGAWTDTGVTTPYTFTGLAVGTYKAKLVKAGYVDGETALQTLTAGGSLTMGATLTAATGNITVNSTPAGARIYYSYNSGAWTDTGVTAPYTFTGLAVGTYKAKLVKAGYVDGETALQTLTAGGSLTMGATLTAATGNITVNSTPAGARIYYSYNSGAWTDTGVTAPYTFTGLAVGTYKAKLVKAGYVDGETALQTLTAGGALTMGATLTAATGSITVNSTPAGARIYYSYNSGAWTDTGVTTPYTFTGLAVGTYKAKLVKAGYVDGETALQTLTAGGALTMGATLTAATGSITVNSTPAGARIYYRFNGGAWTDTGVTTNYSWTDLTPGSWEIGLVYPGYANWDQVRTLSAGDNITVNAVLQR